MKSKNVARRKLIKVNERENRQDVRNAHEEDNKVMVFRLLLFRGLVPPTCYIFLKRASPGECEYAIKKVLILL